MPSPEVSKAIQNLEEGTSASKAEGYSQLLDQILNHSEPSSLSANLIAYVESILGDSLGIVGSRPILSAFVQRFRDVSSNDTQVEVGERVLETLRPKVVSYEEQDSALKDIVATAHEREGNHIAAAKMLQAITLDSSQRTISDDEKAAVWIRIVRNYLEEGETVTAGAYLSRVKGVIYAVKDPEVKLNFDLAQARVYDSQRQFLDAAQRYYSVSNETLIHEDDRLKALSAAMVCAVLAPAGPQRSRVLTRLYKDERSSQIEVYPMLEKIFFDRLLEPSEVKAFSKNLEEHHVARTADGSTVLDKAVLEHNLLAASKLYMNIAFSSLGQLLNVDADKAEGYAAKMIEQGRVAGYIDQIDQVIVFEGEGSGQKKTGHGDALVGGEIRIWDSNVQAMAEEAERISTMIQNQHPEFYEAQMAT